MRVFIKTLGCPKNLVDSEVIAGHILAGENSITESPEEADVIILNTCAFIEEAVKESREEILNLSDHKGKLILTGCLPQRFKSSLDSHIGKETLLRCDFIVGLGRYDFWKNFSDGNLPDSRLFISSEDYTPQDINRCILTPPHYAYVRIAEGCSNRCSYCTIPYIRGPYRSKHIDDIVREAERLTDVGVRELVLIAQDTTNYGVDEYGEYMLPDLLRRLCKIEELYWIRLMYAHPGHFVDELIDVYLENRKICRYIDLPIQHISNPVLEAMGRRVTRERIEDILVRLRKIPGMHIRSEIMVGYPGEGNTEFGELVDFLLSVRFDSLGIFRFSLEEGSPVFDRRDSCGLIPQKELDERYDTVIEIARQLSFEKNLSLMRSRLRIICDYRGVGRTQWQAPDIDGCVFFKGKAKIGEFYNVRIDRVDDYDIYGELVS